MKKTPLSVILAMSVLMSSCALADGGTDKTDPETIAPGTAAEDSTGGIPHHSDVIRVDAISIRILPDEAYRPRYIHRAFLLGKAAALYHTQKSF